MDPKRTVRDTYGKIARQGGCTGSPVPEANASELGYSSTELDSVPDGANMGLGCGNPTALADLQTGETVVDLGSGGGFDCFLAANQVGPTGHVIGVDMTPDMIDKARDNAAKGGRDNVEFRLGEIEHLPVADNSVDVIISNCVINLSPDKPQVFSEAFRVLKPGGRLHISDIVLSRELPGSLRDDVNAYCACVSGASLRDEYLAMMGTAGLTDVTIHAERDAIELLQGCCAPDEEGDGSCGCEDSEAQDAEACCCGCEDDEDPSGFDLPDLTDLEGVIISATISARKPG